MLEIINDLRLFFEDCYKEYGVREYSRVMKISAPTSSKKLKEFENEGLLKKRLDRGYLLFRADRENSIFIDLSRIYWRVKLKKFINYLKEELYCDNIILFGSLAKAETNINSDVDIVVISATKKKLDLKRFEKELKREIQIMKFDSLEKIHKDLRINILNGYILSGRIR